MNISLFSKLAALTFVSACAATTAVAQSCCAPDAQLPSLQAQLDERADQFAASAPEAMKKTFQDGLDHVAKSDAMKTAKKSGHQAPDFTLPDATGEEVTLSKLLKDGPVVLIWYRGGWCPYCNMQLQAMQEALPKIKQLGGTLVAISPEVPDKSLSTKEKDALEFYVLSDVGNRVAKEYGIVYTLDDATHGILEDRLKLSQYNGDASGELPLTVAYVIDQDGLITWDFKDYDYKRRAEPADIIDALFTIQMAVEEPAS